MNQLAELMKNIYCTVEVQHSDARRVIKICPAPELGTWVHDVVVSVPGGAKLNALARWPWLLLAISC